MIWPSAAVRRALARPAAWAILASFVPSCCWGLSGAVPVSFKTRDGWSIHALYHPPKSGEEVAVLIHGLGSSSNEWSDFSPDLWRLGMGTLAIDLRGHGQSLLGPRGREDYRDFDVRGEWPKALGDLLAARTFLRGLGVSSRRVVFIGASVGANLASQAAARTPESPWVVLLSPGEDYHGLFPANLSGRRVLFAASPPDAYAYGTCLELAGRTRGSYFLAARQGHGVQMFKDAKFTAELLRWIRLSLPAPRADRE